MIDYITLNFIEKNGLLKNYIEEQKNYFLFCKKEILKLAEETPKTKEKTDLIKYEIENWIETIITIKSNLNYINNTILKNKNKELTIIINEIKKFIKNWEETLKDFETKKNIILNKNDIEFLKNYWKKNDE